MSDLQLGLALIGAIVIAAVIAYNKWQEARLSKRADRDFGSRHADVLVAGAATPVADDAPAPPLQRAHEPGLPERVEHTIGAVDAPPVPPSAAFAGEEWPDHVVLDPRVDCIVLLACPRAVTGADAMAAARGLVDEGLVKPVRWEGGDAASGPWGPIVSAREYAYLRAGLQLADRSGPATAADIDAFLAGMQEVALALAAELDLPDPDEAAEQARALDGFCADVDVQIGLNVIATAAHPFAGSKLRALAEAGGLRLARDGTFRRIDDGGHELFALANSEDVPFDADRLRTMTTQGVTVVLDVPRAPGNVSTFRLYIDFAHQLEQALGGMLVDDNKKPVGQAALDRIARQLERIYSAMDARGIPAGSPAAQRLFA